MVVAMIGVGVLYGLLILFGQFVAQGVVEEKSSRVVELLLATMKPWQLLAGKIVGLGLLGSGPDRRRSPPSGWAARWPSTWSTSPVSWSAPRVSVVLWFVLGYAFYAAIFAVGRVSGQPAGGPRHRRDADHLLLVAAFVVGIQAAADPDSTLAVVTSYVPGLSPLVMPVRQAAGEVAVWEIGAGRACSCWWRSPSSCGSAAGSTPAPCCAPAARSRCARR